MYMCSIGCIPRELLMCTSGKISQCIPRIWAKFYSKQILMAALSRLSRKWQSSINTWTWPRSTTSTTESTASWSSRSHHTSQRPSTTWPGSSLTELWRPHPQECLKCIHISKCCAWKWAGVDKGRGCWTTVTVVKSNKRQSPAHWVWHN